MNQELKKYIETEIFPQYERYYSHGMMHVENVIKNVILLSEYYKLNNDMAYTIASYHDIGLKINKENHEVESGKILNNDTVLKQYFNEEQIKTMKEAVEDHRGSRKEKPRNKYGEILSDSDRDFEVKILAKRQLATSIKNYPEMKTFDEHFEICYNYISKRINKEGHINLWTNHPILVEKRKKFEEDFFNKDYTREIYRKEYERISADGTIDKIINYYLDY